MRVFVLCTGRCGSTTFASACNHLDNYTSAHQSNAVAQLFDARFVYPDDHIEVDNRLAWFLGGLARRFDDRDTLYVHLTRDPEEVAQSYNKRWELRQGIVPAFAQGVLLTDDEWADADRLDVCRFFVQTVTDNINEFLSSRPSIDVRLENIGDDFEQFLDHIDASGDVDAARAEWSVRHNASAD